MAQVKVENVKHFDRESWLAAVWLALEEWDDYVADDIEAGEAEAEQHALNHDEICTAMAWIREELGLPMEVDQ